MHSFVCIFHLYVCTSFSATRENSDYHKYRENIEFFLVAADSVSCENISQEFGQYNYKNAGVIIWAKVKC